MRGNLFNLGHLSVHNIPTHAHKGRLVLHSSRAGTRVGVGSRHLSLRMGYFDCSEVNPKDWFRVLAYSWHFLVSFKENQFVLKWVKADMA